MAAKRAATKRAATKNGATKRAKPAAKRPATRAPGAAPAPYLLREGTDDNGKAFAALLESKKATEASDLALSLVEHFAFVSLVQGGRIYLRSWAPTEKNSKPNLMVRFLDKGKSRSSDGLCTIFATGKVNITMAPITARAPKAAKALVKRGVHADADQRSYDATPEIVAALTAAAMEWAADRRSTPNRGVAKV